MSNVQHAIKKAIQLCGGKQITLARKAGVSQNAVSKLESGASKRAMLDTAQKLSAAVGNRIHFTEFMGVGSHNDYDLDSDGSAEAENTAIKPSDEGDKEQEEVMV